MKRLRHRPWMGFLLVVLSCPNSPGQTGGEQSIGTSITYISGPSLYLGAGSTRSLAVGDTGVVVGRGTPAPRVVIGAVSSSSSVARLVKAGDSVAVGDSVVFRKAVATPPPTSSSAKAVEAPPQQASSTVHGRVSLQYAGWGDLGSDADNAHASLVVALDAAQLLGTGFRLTAYGRLTSALHQDPATQDPEQKLNARVFDLALWLDDPGSWFSVAFGRITSRYAGGIGIVDGTQLTARTGPWTVGLLGGFQPDYRTSQFNTQHTKGLAFLNYVWGSRENSPGSTTIAYGTQYYKGSLDRDYLYLQNSFALNARFFLYQSSEIDLHTESGGALQQAFRLTNTFVTFHYVPASWVTLNAGYDAHRPVDLFESLKLIPDSLFEKDLRQGVRAGAYFRLPLNLSLTATGGYRFPVEDERAGYNVGGGVRATDIRGTGFSAGARYQKVRGIYTDGSDLTVDIHQAIASSLFLGIQYDRYAFTDVKGTEQSTITTASLTMNWLFARSWYVTLTGDRVWNTGQDLYRLFAEFGTHF